MSYFWIFGDNTSANTINATHYYTTSGIFSVTLIAEPNTLCADTIIKEIELASELSPKIYIPNCFTPNGDFKNDFFRAEGHNLCKAYEIAIFNRWGQIIFYSNQMPFNWDGKHHSKDVPEGVYYYILTSENLNKYGSVTLLRTSLKTPLCKSI